MRTIKELKDSLLEEMSQILGREGYKRREWSFIRKFELGKQIFHLNFVEHRKYRDVDVIADVAIRFDKVEDMTNASNKMLSKKEKAETATMGAELGNILGVGQKRWTMTAGTDISATASSIYQEFCRVGKPYLDKYSSHEAAFEALRRDDDKAWLYQPIDGERAKSAVALAVLLGDEKLVKETIAAKTRYLEERIARSGSRQDQFNLAQFRQFLSYHGLIHQ